MQILSTQKFWFAYSWSHQLTLSLNLDFGTGSVRAGIYDFTRSKLVDSEEAPYETFYPRIGWAEQDPNEWVAAMVKCVRTLLHKSKENEFEAICVSTTSSTVVSCDSLGQCNRNAILWMDARATYESKLTENTDHPVMDFCGGSDASEWLVPKAMWIKKNEPEIWQKSEMICEALDYINFRLTGLWCGSKLNATCKWNYDSVNETLVYDLFDQLSISDLISKLPQNILPVGTPISRLTKKMASILGLKNRPIVVQGGIDAHMAMLGCNSLMPGGMLFIGGTSNVQLFQLSQPKQLPGFWGPYPNAIIRNKWLVECGQVAAGSQIDWLVNKIFKWTKTEHKQMIQTLLNAPNLGSDLLALDFWMGNRTPYRNSNLRGSITGLTLGHDQKHIYAAFIDSISLGTKNIFSHLDALGIGFNDCVIAGGITKNEAWLTATIAAINKRVRVVKNDNLTLIGNAAACGLACGLYESLDTSAKALQADSILIEPSKSLADQYNEFLPIYQQYKDGSFSTMIELAKRQETS